jgi:predicted Kef-type K+ transport protein
VSGAGGQRRGQAPAAPSPRDELADATPHGEVYLRRLRQAQLSLSVSAFIAFGTIFGVLPIALYLLPALQRAHLLGVPVAVWLVAVPIFPLLFVIGAVYARRADALDESFRELVRRR